MRGQCSEHRGMWNFWAMWLRSHIMTIGHGAWLQIFLFWNTIITENCNNYQLGQAKHVDVSIHSPVWISSVYIVHFRCKGAIHHIVWLSKVVSAFIMIITMTLWSRSNIPLNWAATITEFIAYHFINYLYCVIHSINIYIYMLHLKHWQKRKLHWQNILGSKTTNGRN